MKRFSAILWALISLQVMAQQPVFKIDFNEPSRSNMEEVLEPGYTPWPLRKDCVSDSLSVDGVRFIVTSKNGGTMRVGWSKAFVQTKENNARLTGDGVNFDPGITGSIELAIAGLPVGDHTIQTFHNSWKDSTVTSAYPMSVWLNGKLAEEHVNRTFMETVSSDASIVQLSFHVATAQDTIRIEFVTYDSVPPAVIKSKQEYSPLFNGFEMNTVTAKALAKRPVPADADMHVDADSGSVLLTWSPASSDVVKHYLYIGCDSVAVASADTFSTVFVGEKTYADTTYLLGSVYNLNTYYWRVDEMDKEGTLTPGTMWSFRPRHLAFRGAEGYGRFATGGRGGKVVYVTNLNDSGEGSFRYAIENESGPRTIVFNVSGIIRLNGRLTVSDKYVTIAGQTAPGKGICFRGAAMGMGSESITRFIRNRVGSGTTYDGMGLRGGDHAILDHCSISWSIDEGFSCREAKNVTLQRTMIAEPLNIAGHDKYTEGSAHGFSAVFDGDIGSFHHNIMAHARGRNPRMDGGMDGNGYYTGRLDIFNNVVYNWSSYGGNGEAHEANFVNNYYKKGPATGSSNVIVTADVNQRGSNKGTESYYFEGNVLSAQNGQLIYDGFQPHGENGDYGVCWRLVNSMPVDWTVWQDKPFYPSFAQIETAQDAYKNVLSNVGCNMPVFDEHDQRIVHEIQTGTYAYTGSLCGLKGVIDSEADCGGYEDYGTEVRPNNFDSDWDGLPDWWENLYGSNPNSASGDFSDANADPDHDGYTALEDYLEWMSVPHYYLVKNQSKEIELASYAVGYAKTPVYAAAQCDPVLGLQFNASNVTVTPVADYTGISYFDFTVTDSENSSMTRRVGVYVQDSLPDATTSVWADATCAFSVYPMVFDRELTIEAQSEGFRTISISLLDMTGRSVYSENCELSAGTKRIQLASLSNLAPQMYLLEMRDAATGVRYDVKRVIKK